MGRECEAQRREIPLIHISGVDALLWTNPTRSLQSKEAHQCQEIQGEATGVYRVAQKCAGDDAYRRTDA
jgi:hypothetical protein